jgi:hypothetical protein
MSAIKCNLCNNVIYFKDNFYRFKCFNDGCPILLYKKKKNTFWTKVLFIGFGVYLVLAVIYYVLATFTLHR